MAPAIQKTMGLTEWGMLAALGIIWGGSFYFFAIAIGELGRASVATLLRLGPRRLILKDPKRTFATMRQQFMANVLSLRAKRQAPQLSATETELLLQINQGLPDELRNRYDCLIQKRKDETVSADEHLE